MPIIYSRRGDRVWFIGPGVVAILALVLGFVLVVLGFDTDRVARLLQASLRW